MLPQAVVRCSMLLLRCSILLLVLVMSAHTEPLNDDWLHSLKMAHTKLASAHFLYARFFSFHDTFDSLWRTVG